MLATKRKAQSGGLEALGEGSKNERYLGLSFVQLRVPRDLHYELRKILLDRRLSVNSIAEDMIRVFLSYLEANVDYVPSDRHNLTTRPLKKRGRKRKEETALMNTS